MIHRHRPNKAQSTAALFLAILILIALITHWIDISIITGPLYTSFHLQESPQTYSEEFDCSIKCSDTSPLSETTLTASNHECPEYFRWIHEDLQPWKDTGITKEMVEKSKNVAHMRIIIVNSRLYTIKYKPVYQTRDVVTIWGILQLLRLYPGRVPDLDLMFEYGDKPVITKQDFGGNGGPSSPPPPVFHYCGDDTSYDIVFPDWSFWGWPELNIKPWVELKEDLKEGNGRIKWEDREPYAFWRGNPLLGAARHDLVRCNGSDGEDWKARLFKTDWIEEKRQGFNTANLSSQCNYRYKIYVEGVSWSVSEKYILACDSMSLIIKPRYHDFFSRSLLPWIHYWPVNEHDKCRSIKFAVEWGNYYTDKAQEIGSSGSKFIQEELEMENVYDYMFHVLNEYAKLLKYKPTIPKEATEVCSETSVCSVKGSRKKFRIHSMVKNPSHSLPCSLPPAYEPEVLRDFLEKKENLTKQVRLWEES